MKIVVLNILIYHEKACKWWGNCLSGIEIIGIPWVVILGFLRITTNPRIMPKPLTFGQSIELIEDWLNQVYVQIITPTSRHWDILKQYILHFGTASNLINDAHIATLTVEKGGTLYSTDNDFSRYPNLKWINPLIVVK